MKKGLPYPEVAKIVGDKPWNVMRRNHTTYKIDLSTAFKEKIRRNGMPCRLNIPDNFGYYFSGLFDGEGSLLLWHRNRKDGFSEYRLGVRMSLRDDDAKVLREIQQKLGGRLAHNKAHGATNPSLQWTFDKIKDMAEIAIPLFERYPLKTKKRLEYKLWKSLVLDRYVETLGGCVRAKINHNFKRRFLKAMKIIQGAREYR